jgi:hypothetical protein
VSPREQPLKLLHGVQSHVNKYSLPRRVCNYVHRIVFQFYVCFWHVYPSCVNYLFPILPLVRDVQSCRMWVCLRYLRLIWGPLVIFLLGVPCCRMAALWKKLMLNKGSRVCIILSLVLYPKHVYFASLALTAEYWGSGHRMSLNKAIT